MPYYRRPDTTMQWIATELRRRRREQRIKQYVLARDLNVSQAYLCHLEKMHCEPRLAFLEEWADALGTTLLSLLQAREAESSD